MLKALLQSPRRGNGTEWPFPLHAEARSAIPEPKHCHCSSLLLRNDLVPTHSPDVCRIGCYDALRCIRMVHPRRVEALLCSRGRMYLFADQRYNYNQLHSHSRQYCRLTKTTGNRNSHARCCKFTNQFMTMQWDDPPAMVCEARL